jgi:endoglucanase
VPGRLGKRASEREHSRRSAGLADLPRDRGPATDPSGELTAARIADLAHAVEDPEGTLKARARHLVCAPHRVLLGRRQRTAAGCRRHAQRLLTAGVRYGDGRAGTRPHPLVRRPVLLLRRPGHGAPGNAVSPTDPTTWRWTDAWFDQHMGAPPAGELRHLVIDTSRNGRYARNPTPGEYGGAPEAGRAESAARQNGSGSSVRLVHRVAPPGCTFAKGGKLCS